MTDSVLSDAIKEAYAVAPTDVVLIHTIEIRHPSFVDDDGNATAIRVTNNNENITATLEDDAPLHPSTAVEFISLPFTITQPTISKTSSPSATLSIDNISREMIKYIDLAAQSIEPTKATYRPYLNTDLSVPHYNPPIHLTLKSVNANELKITGELTFPDFANKSFPNDLYTRRRFPGLAR